MSNLKIITAVMFASLIFLASIAWSVIQYDQCRHNPQNTKLFCIGHML